MMLLSEEQLNNLNKEALVIIIASLQNQLGLMQSQPDTANAQLADTNRQIELLTEQIRIMNQRQFGRQSETGIMEGHLPYSTPLTKSKQLQIRMLQNLRFQKLLSLPIVVKRQPVNGILIWKDFLHVS